MKIWNEVADGVVRIEVGDALIDFKLGSVAWF
jgi:hypothetical protein